MALETATLELATEIVSGLVSLVALAQKEAPVVKGAISDAVKLANQMKDSWNLLVSEKPISDADRATIRAQLDAAHALTQAEGQAVLDQPDEE